MVSEGKLNEGKFEERMMELFRRAVAEQFGPPAPMVYDLEQAAKLLGVNERTVRRMVATSQLLTVRIGRTPKIPRSELMRISTPKGLGARGEFGRRPPARAEVKRANARSKARHSSEVAKAAALVEARRRRHR